MKLHHIVLTADQDYECDACDYVIPQGMAYVSIVHGDHRDNVCLACNERRVDKTPAEAEVVIAQ